ncbi:MAG: MFS transporter [Pseudomonadales bacterium]|nr:MFS transporter [Pseudomonadales bacterium]
MRLKHLLAVVTGNALEFYDFLTFGFFAIYIGRAFFPSDNPTTSLLASLATFGAGFITRPIGAIVIGSMGDRVGRKPAMVLSFSLMGIGIAGLALTPSYAQIGMLAPALVILFRLIQGFALGGEVGPTTAYVLEAAPIRYRGLYSSLQSMTQEVAVLVAGLVGFVLANLLDGDQLQAWGWRVAMLLGIVVIPFGLYMRRRLPESLHRADDAALAPDATTGVLTFGERMKPWRRLAVLGLMMLTAGTIGSYVSSYMTTYAIATLGMPANIAFGVTVIGSLFAFTIAPLSGSMSDRVGRKPVMIVSAVLLLCAILPAFWLINAHRTPFVLYGAMALLNLLSAASFVPVLCALTESLPPRIRAGTLATIYAFAISIFGGTTQVVITWLIDRTGDPMAPAWYWTGALTVGIVAMVKMKESAPLADRHGGGASQPAI